MRLKEFKQLLEGLDDDVVVYLSNDPEGNEIMDVSQVSESRVGDREDGKVISIIIWPKHRW